MTAELRRTRESASITSGMHCLFSGMHHILARERPEIAAETGEAEIYLETNGLNLAYYGDLNKVWLASQQDILEAFAHAYGLELEASFEVSNNPEEALSRLREAVRQGRLPLLFVRTTALSYHEVFRDGEERNHIILLLTWDDENDRVVIGDTSFLDQAGHVTTYEGELPLDAIRSGLWGYAWLQTDPAREPLPRADRFALANRHIAAFVQGSVLVGSRYQGMLAYRMYVRDYDRLLALSDEAFASVCRNIYYCYRVGGMLHLLDYVIGYIRQQVERQMYTENALRIPFEQLRDQWRKLLMQLYKVGLTIQRDKILLLQTRFTQLLDESEEGLRRLLELKQGDVVEHER